MNGSPPEMPWVPIRSERGVITCDFAVPEPFAAAAIVDGGRAARSLEHLGGAIGPAMFEPGECRNVRNALVERRFAIPERR